MNLPQPTKPTKPTKPTTPEPFQYPLKELQLSDSTLGTYHSCERKLEFSKLYGVNRRGSSLPGDAGSAMHGGFQTWFRTKDKTAAIWELMWRYPSELRPKYPNDNRSLESCYAALVMIMNSSLLDGYELVKVILDDGKHVDAVEVPFVINIKNFELDPNRHIPIKYRGYMDLILYNKLEDRYIVCDIKTLFRNLYDPTPAFEFSQQCLPYAMVLERALKRPIETLDVLYLVVKMDLLEPQLIPLEFHKSAEMIDDFAKTLLLDLFQIRTFYQTQWFPRRSSGCTAYNRTCRYYELCHTRNPKTIKTMLEAEPQEPPKELVPWFVLDLELMKALD